MKKSFLLLLLITSFSLVSCSQSNTVEEDAGDSGIQLTDADEFLEEDSGDVVADNTSANTTDAPMVQPVGGELASYAVKKNETLMLIAFKIYGDYGKWKELAKLNEGLNVNSLKEGDTLQYYAPVQEFVWSPEGNPYLIKKGDTLGTVSNDTYGTTKFWRDIWSNNKPLIKDPNKIFAGFTIYTPVLENREVASQQ